MLIVHSFDPVVLVGGADLGPEDFNIVQTEMTTFVGVDGGADHLLGRGITPVAVIGDFDSLSDAARAAFGPVLHHIPEQATVDFEKAVSNIDAPLIYAVGFAGGRLDHTLAVLHVMGRYKDRSILLVSADDVSMIVPDTGLTLSLEVGTRISLMPLTGSTVQATGLRWDVDGQGMEPLGFTSPSNEVAAPTVTLAAQGCVIVTVPRSALGALAQGAVRAK